MQWPVCGCVAVQILVPEVLADGDWKSGQVFSSLAIPTSVFCGSAVGQFLV